MNNLFCGAQVINMTAIALKEFQSIAAVQSHTQGYAKADVSRTVGILFES